MLGRILHGTRLRYLYGVPVVLIRAQEQVQVPKPLAAMFLRFCVRAYIRTNHDPYLKGRNEMLHSQSSSESAVVSDSWV